MKNCRLKIRATHRHAEVTHCVKTEFAHVLPVISEIRTKAADWNVVLTANVHLPAHAKEENVSTHVPVLVEQMQSVL